jgi:hypothetical protein
MKQQPKAQSLIHHSPALVLLAKEELSQIEGGGTLLDQIIQVIKAGSEIIKNVGPVIT